MSFPPPDPAHDTAPPAHESLATPSSSTAVDPSVRPGDLAPAWRVMLGLGWIAAFFAYAGVWQASVQIGIGTWWIGPRAQPTNVAIKILPFLLALIIGLLVTYNVKRIIRWSAAGVVAAVLISIPDFSRSVGLGVAEAAIAGLLGVITLMSLSGRYRAAEPQPGASATPLPGPAPFDPASQ